jgi:hypothetical protein
MGACMSKPGAELPGASAEEIEQLRDSGHLPCVAGPKIDFEGKNQLATLYVAEYENGAELTLLFLDEDRPNMCTDCIYDHIRRPLFGRWSDIETIIVIGDKVEFPGTYSADQTWSAKVPAHNEASIALSKFEKENDEPILWVNTWNHLLGEKNTNPDKEITRQHALPAESTESLESKDFVVRKGSRAEVDERFKGVITSVSKVMTPERQEKLGKRLF